MSEGEAPPPIRPTEDASIAATATARCRHRNSRAKTTTTTTCQTQRSPTGRTDTALV